MQIEQILTAAIRGGASDVILKTGTVPRFRFVGQLVALANGEIIRPEHMQAWVQQLYPGKFDPESFLDLDFAFQNRDGHRFRVNVFKQRGQIGMALRVILKHIRTLEELQLPSVIQKLVRERRGLILITGSTGSGKSTTMAALVDKINLEASAHIVTIEDPIEFLFTDKTSVIEQREVGLDTPSFASAIRAAMRQSPDVIMVGELRDEETVRSAVQAAETGHLVLSTLHTADATESLQRMLNFFEPAMQVFARRALSQTLKAVISQRLVARRASSGLIPAVEILIANGAAKEAVLKGDFHLMRDIISEGREAWGMQSFDQSLVKLCQDGFITREEALKHATSRGNVDLELSGIGSA